MPATPGNVGYESLELWNDTSNAVRQEIIFWKFLFRSFRGEALGMTFSACICWRQELKKGATGACLAWTVLSESCFGVGGILWGPWAWWRCVLSIVHTAPCPETPGPRHSCLSVLFLIPGCEIHLLLPFSQCSGVPQSCVIIFYILWSTELVCS